jgi:hypothetical protein
VRAIVTYALDSGPASHTGGSVAIAKDVFSETVLLMSISERMRRWFPQLMLGVLAAAALLRLGALRSEFWLDEIWSWEFSRAAASPWHIFAGADQHHDNNHKLNTLFLWLYPSGASWGMYRLHSLAAGLATVALAALLARRRGRFEALCAALLFASNYWLVLCSAEARGYALAVLFALLAFYALQGYLLDGRRSMLLWFWLAVILGFSAHLTFLHVYLGLGLWSVYRGARSGLSRREEIRQLLACHLVPCLFLLALYLVDVRRMQFGGGPPQPASLVVARLLSLGLGVAPSAAAAAVVVFTVLTLIFGLRQLAREREGLGLFFGTVIVGSPALFLLGKPAYLFERYFLISFVFFLLLLSFVLGALRRRSRAGSFLAVLVMLAIVGGGTMRVVAFERGGRGHFLDALAYIERQSPEQGATLCGDYDFRVRKMYRFYVPYLAAPERLVYRPQETLPPQGADWLLVHRIDAGYPLYERMHDKHDNVYRRVVDFPADAFGGWSWHVYRNEKNP